ncbi:MAG: nucleotidyl transferase AbiEii/AbiGii toxin family protein, partial [Acidimicrobiaceae bacterium]|nr:nucleotidyl transferase AbiEii/AbiGii toxin family protein [Acidimicrobiaceae bacterium]
RQELVERDYWMFQVSRHLLGESKGTPGSFTSMGGGSMLALTGIVERVSEDADFSVSYSGGVRKCSSHKGKKLMVEFQRRVEDALDMTAERLGGGGGNTFRTTRYHYQSVFPSHDASPRPWIESDLGLRDTDDDFLVEMPGRPYLAHVAEQHDVGVCDDLQERALLCSHPLSVLADKLDAVCWREGQVPTEGHTALESLVSRIRDHYDLYRLIGWLHDKDMLHNDRVLAAVEHMRRSDATIREMRRVARPQRNRPAAGYSSLRAWQHGTEEYGALHAAFPSLSGVVYGHLPDYSEVAERIHAHADAL